MQQPPSRKGVADVAAQQAEDEAEGPPTSPITYLELDTESFNGVRSYKGKFKYKVPTMGDRVDIGVLKARYVQQLERGALDASPDNIAEALAYLNVTLDPEEVPQWWKDANGGIDLYDFTPLLTLYADARAYEATFLGGRAEPGRDDDADEGGAADDADGDVGGDVQDPPVGRQVLASFGKGGGGADPSGAGGGSAEG